MADTNERPPRCVVIAYDEDAQALNVCTVSRASMEKRMEAALTVPWPLEDEHFRLDDEFARKLGGLVFNLLAVHQTELKQYISITPHPDANKPPAD
ncbi:hypothetical protein P3T23_000368 [Paraburkholderia sp. GAS448]|uniref:hypothetical protein n=1 Tax=Paraburkholderia sp. GAS448 TaxID=3035136 RepID=UPI003D237955